MPEPACWSCVMFAIKPSQAKELKLFRNWGNNSRMTHTCTQITHTHEKEENVSKLVSFLHIAKLHLNFISICNSLQHWWLWLVSAFSKAEFLEHRLWTCICLCKMGGNLVSDALYRENWEKSPCQETEAGSQTAWDCTTILGYKELYTTRGKEIRTYTARCLL